MLHRETIEPTTLELLIELQADQILNDFFLVGGTALSLQIGHRLSIDLDFFNLKPFNSEEILLHLEKQFGFVLNYQSKNTLKGTIRNIKVDFITHQYPLIDKFVMIDVVKMASIKEIAAMKLNAIMGNGTRLKDFIDIAFLSSLLSLNEMLISYEQKYQTRNPIMASKAITYFKDINHEETITLLHNNYSWSKVERRLKEMINFPNKTFKSI